MGRILTLFLWLLDALRDQCRAGLQAYTRDLRRCVPSLSHVEGFGNGALYMGGVSNVARGGRGDGIKSGGAGPGSPSHCYLATLGSAGSVRPHTVSSNISEVRGR